MAKVSQMISSRSGRPVANQFIIDGSNDQWDIKYFQSYKSVIAMINTNKETGVADVTLDSTYWDYSRTTSRYRNQFLNETTKETQAKINSGEYVLDNLN